MLAAKQPFLLEENRLPAGRIIITASPSMEAPKIRTLRVRYPDKPVLGEPEVIWLLFQSVWKEAAVWWPMWKEAIRVAKREPLYVTSLEGIVIWARKEDEWWQWEFAEEMDTVTE